MVSFARFMAPPSLPKAQPGGPPAGDHFRAHARRAVRLDVTLELLRATPPVPATLVDVSLAGAGLELDVLLAPGERIRLVMATPTLWDPLVVPAMVAWSDPGRPGVRPRAGVRFDHQTPESVFATWEMLSALLFD